MSQLRVSGKALPAHSRQHNRALVLQVLFHEGAMSRADLARATGLTPVTISDLVSGLTSDGLLRDLGRRAGARVGKPATLIALDADASHVIGLDLSAPDEFVGAVLNLTGDIVHRRTIPRTGATGAAAVDKAMALASELVGLSEVRVLGIGVATPGVVDRAGVVREAPNLGWSDLDLAARFADRFGLPSVVSNDANAAALAVHTFEKTAGENLMLVNVSEGVGAGLIIGGALVAGDHFTAGEIGHVVVDEGGALCRCGRRGCLELAVSVPHVRPQLLSGGAQEREETLRAAGRALGGALSPVIAALGVSTVIVVGPADIVPGPLLAATRETVERRTLPTVTRELQLRAADEGDELALRGTTALVLAAELGIS